MVTTIIIYIICTRSDIRYYVNIKAKEALEQLFKQAYDAILKNRPELGDTQMPEALARALPEHKRRHCMMSSVHCAQVIDV